MMPKGMGQYIAALSVSRRDDAVDDLARPRKPAHGLTGAGQASDLVLTLLAQPLDQTRLRVHC